MDIIEAMINKRKDMGLSVMEAAVQIGCSVSFLHKIEKKAVSITLDMSDKLSAFYEMHIPPMKQPPYVPLKRRNEMIEEDPNTEVKEVEKETVETEELNNLDSSQYQLLIKELKRVNLTLASEVIRLASILSKVKNELDLVEDVNLDLFKTNVK